MRYTTKPLTAQTWDDFATLVEAHNGVWGGCWCMGLHPEGVGRGHTPQGNRDAKRARTLAGAVHQILVYTGGECVGWCQYGTPAELPNINNRKKYELGVTDPPDWRIGCIFTASRHRGHGVARAAVGAALQAIAAAGGGVVEAYPEQTAERAPQRGAYLHTGPEALYEQFGFVRDRRIAKWRWVMRAQVAAAGSQAGARPAPARRSPVSITVRPATAGRWDDVAAVFSGRGGSTCWCRRFAGAEEADRPGALRREIEHAEQPVGLIAYVDDEPAGWSRVAPRASIPGVAANRSLRRFYLGDHAEPAWWISCFMVRREQRGAGVGLALLREAARFARRNGAAVLDGHPVDAARLRRHSSPAAVFTGTRSMFVAAGFREIGRTYPTRPVMRRDLRP